MEINIPDSRKILESTMPQIEHYSWKAAQELGDMEFALLYVYASEESELWTALDKLFPMVPDIEPEEAQEFGIVTCVPIYTGDIIAAQSSCSAYDKEKMKKPAPAGKVKLFLITENGCSLAHITPRSHTH